MQIDTIYGPMDAEQLERRVSTERGCTVVEYLLNGEVVHRQVSTQLAGLQAAGVAKD